MGKGCGELGLSAHQAAEAPLAELEPLGSSQRAAWPHRPVAASFSQPHTPDVALGS